MFNDKETFQGKKALKIAYNKLVYRHDKAIEYLANGDIPIEIRESNIPEYEKLLKTLSKALDDLRANKIGFTPDEAFNGFRIL